MPPIDVSSIPWCKIRGGGYYGDINVLKSLTISIRSAEASLRCSYGDGDGDTTPYEAGETLKLQNPSCCFMHYFFVYSTLTIGPSSANVLFDTKVEITRRICSK